jgi:hypothetical protein
MMPIVHRIDIPVMNPMINNTMPRTIIAGPPTAG